MKADSLKISAHFFSGGYIHYGFTSATYQEYSWGKKK